LNDMDADPARIDSLLTHAEWLRSLALRLVGDADLADDVVQDTWISALRSPPRVDASARPWLATVLRNLVRQRSREQRSRAERERAAARPEAVAPESDSVARAQSMRRLLDELLRLDEPYRTTLLLRFQEGLDVETVARRQRVTPSSVRSRTTRGLAELRRRLESRDGADWRLALAPLLRTAPWSGAATSGLAIALLGTLTMKKLAVAAVLVVLFAAWAWRAGDPGVATSSESAELTAKLDVGERAETSAAREEPSRPTVDRVALAPMTESARETAASIAAHVVWAANGADAADVNLELLDWTSTNPFSEHRFATTDARGVARFEGLHAGNFTVKIDRADGESVELSNGEQRTLELAIPVGVRVLGRVVDARGAPVAGARVWLSDYGNGSCGSEVTRSAAGGRFTIEHVGEGRSVCAFADGFAPAAQLDVFEGPGGECELTLELGDGAGVLEGVVLDSERNPVPHASILQGNEHAHVRVRSDGGSYRSAPAQRALADAEGRFRIVGVEVGRSPLAVRAGEFAPWRESVEVVATRTSHVEVVLQRAFAVEGVVRTQDGAPVEDARLSVGGYGEFDSSRTRSGADGSFRLNGLSPGSVLVNVAAGARGRASKTLVGTPSETVRWDPVLHANASVAGVVVDEASAPLEGWMVGAIRFGHRGLFLRSATTDAQGRFELTDWPDDAEAIEVREPSNWTSPAAATVPHRPSGEPLRIVVRANDRSTARVRAMVFGPDGAVLRQVDAVLWPDEFNMGANGDYDADTGRLECGPVKPGLYRLSVSAPGLGTLPSARLELAADETRDLGVLRFESPGRVRVRLVGAPALIAEQPHVALRQEGEEFATAIETRDGAGASGILSPGDYDVELLDWRLARRSKRVTVRSGEESEVELDLEPGTSRQLDFRVEDGVSLPPSVRVELRDARGELVESRVTRIGETGELRSFVVGLVLGVYTVDAFASDGRRASATFEVVELDASPTTTVLTLR